MNKEFVPYEPSLRLKALGFDEPCFATWSGETLDMSLQIPSDDYFTKAPTFSQAFRWFREKYDMCPSVEEIHSERVYKYAFRWGGWGYTSKTYEEAELACLIKLIEIVE